MRIGENLNLPDARLLYFEGANFDVSATPSVSSSENSVSLGSRPERVCVGAIVTLEVLVRSASALRFVEIRLLDMDGIDKNQSFIQGCHFYN